ncbi:MAG: hypothetical protein JNK53_08430, partial [Phycisphaerae bacterium]|nr:hypothetical protein [Phycisphaerae bacterium]
MFAVLISFVLALVPPGDGAFQTASVAPADVQLLVRVKDGAALRRDGSLAALHTALAKLAGDRMLTMAWSALAAPMETDGGGLFDALLGTDATYLERTREGALEWALVTRMSQGAYDQLVERLKPSMQGGGVVVFGAQGLKAAWRPPVLVVGPSARAGLSDAVLAAVDAPAAASAAAAPANATPAAASSLADHAEVKHAATWPCARVELVLQTAGERAGVTVATLAPADGSVAIRHRSTFAKAPIHVAPGAPADLGLIAPFAADSLAVFAMNPWRGELDPSEPVDALLLEGRLDDAMRTNMGARQLLVIGEHQVSESGMRGPTIGLAFEVRDPVLAERQWDDWARRFVEQMAARANTAPPERPVAEPGKARTANIQALFTAALADHPLSRRLDLCWLTLVTPDGAWQVLATDREL